MKLIKPSIKFLDGTKRPLETIERAGRTCYKSEERIVGGSSLKFVQRLLDRGHLAMIEHAYASYLVITDRGVTHEIVRHRLFSYAQESTRYCNYRGGVTFVLPPWMKFRNDNQISTGDILTDEQIQYYFDYEPASAEYCWLLQLLSSEIFYQQLLKSGWSPQQARGVLPNALKTEIVMTGNLREVANALLKDLRSRVSIVFDELINSK